MDSGQQQREKQRVLYCVVVGNVPKSLRRPHETVQEVDPGICQRMIPGCHKTLNEIRDVNAVHPIHDAPLTLRALVYEGVLARSFFLIN